MTESLVRINNYVSFIENNGETEEELEKKLREAKYSLSEGDFTPQYRGRKWFSGPEIYFHSDKIDLNIGNLKRLDALAKKRGLKLLFDKVSNKAIIGYEKRFIPWQKEIVQICASGIIVKQPKYVIASQKGLLEEVGSVFGMKT
jgi:hypothetical protein